MTTDFWGFRRLWFALNLGFVVHRGNSRGAAPRPSPRDARRVAHAVRIAGPAIIATFQAGNVQMAMIALSALAMYSFDRKAHALGGALLAFAILGKLYPGVFVLYLLLQREWRAVAWTAVFGVALIVVSLADVGWEPYPAFLHEMPGLIEPGRGILGIPQPGRHRQHGSVPGLVFKLKMWGAPYMGFEAMRIVG